MKKLMTILIGLALLTACGLSYKETKRKAQENRREALRRDSAALKIAVLPTLDCLPLYVAEHYQLYDTIYGGVRLKLYQAQMDCDTALMRGRVEGMMTDLVRAKRMELRGGMKLRYVATTQAYWLLIANRNARVRQLKQLEDKMVAMTRHSATDMLTDWAGDSAKLDPDRLFKVQVNDLGVRYEMLQNNEIDALWLPEPLATQARMARHSVVADSRATGMQLGAMVFREKEMLRQARSKQLALLVKAYNSACDSINRHGIARYRQLMASRCGIGEQIVDSLPATIKYEHARGPRQHDVTRVEKWLEGK